MIEDEAPEVTVADADVLVSSSKLIKSDILAVGTASAPPLEGSILRGEASASA